MIERLDLDLRIRIPDPLNCFQGRLFIFNMRKIDLVTVCDIEELRDRREGKGRL